MTTFRLPSITYPRPAAEAAATAWGADWRRRWLRQVGSVHEYHLNGALVAFYSNERDPAIRLALQAELESQQEGVAQVLAACRAEADRFDRSMSRECAA